VASSDRASVTLLEAAREGDALAWSHLCQELTPLVLGYLRAQRLPDAEDVAGEVMLEVVRDLGRFQGDAAGFRSWVLSIARHRLIDARRRAQRRPSPVADLEPEDLFVATEVGPEESTVAADGFVRLQTALADLTEAQRTVLLLRVIGDLSIAEVARITGKRPGAVKQLQRRAAAGMRRALEERERPRSTSGERDPSPVARGLGGALLPVDGHADGR
jgi:RNA polymerase sigma-70 factor (ECF subfamily)